MLPNSTNEELESKKGIGTRDFELLSANGNLGIYEECELTHIFLFEPKTKSYYHYFALVSYEEFTEVDDSKRDCNITERLIPINSKLKLGISKKRISLEYSKTLFTQLCAKTLSFQKIDFILSQQLHLLPKTHIPSLWGHDAVMPHRILKPNFWGDRYVLEFSTPVNPMNSLLNDEELNKVNAEIVKRIPIDLGSLYDKIGSFIFQFPITLVSGNASITQDWTKVILSMNLHPDLANQSDLFTIATARLDDTETGHTSFSGPFTLEELEIGDSNNLEFKIFNRRNGLIYKSQMGNFIRGFNFNIGMAMQGGEPRVFTDSQGERHEIILFSNDLGVRTDLSPRYDSRTRARILQNEIINRSGRFLSVHGGERNKALEFVRDILKSNSSTCSEIWLWDPYLLQADIFDTLYFVPAMNLQMKCITSYKQSRKREEEGSENVVEFIENQRKMFLSKSENNLGIRLEFRVAHGGFGFDFHDRFLLIIPREIGGLPTVFSLGTSINCLGKSHHLIQQTLDPRDIIETFRELWGLLDRDDCLIVKFPEERHA